LDSLNIINGTWLGTTPQDNLQECTWKLYSPSIFLPIRVLEFQWSILSALSLLEKCATKTIGKWKLLSLKSFNFFSTPKLWFFTVRFEPKTLGLKGSNSNYYIMDGFQCTCVYIFFIYLFIIWCLLNLADFGIHLGIVK